jgi:hypothetical protein
LLLLPGLQRGSGRLENTMLAFFAGGILKFKNNDASGLSVIGT